MNKLLDILANWFNRFYDFVMVLKDKDGNEIARL